MAKKKNKNRHFRVRYHAEAECDGTVIYTIEDEDIPKKGKSIDMTAFKSDLESEAEAWAEGEQSIVTPPKHGTYSARADWDTQREEWMYWPRVSIEDVEEVTDELELIGTAEICPTKMQAFIPIPKGRVKNPVFYECWVHRTAGEKDVKVLIEAEPGQSLRVEVDTRSKSKVEDTLKSLQAGDLEANTKKEAKEIQGLFNGVL